MVIDKTLKKTMQWKKREVKRDVSKKTPAAVLTIFGLRWIIIWVERRFIISPYKIQHKYGKPFSFPVQRQHRYFGFFPNRLIIQYMLLVWNMSIVYHSSLLVYNVLYKTALAVHHHKPQISTTYIVLTKVRSFLVPR